MHKFEIVKEKIKEMLNDMEIDEILPTYIQLTERFNVSEITVRKALIDLQNEGYIYSKRRLGMYKARPKLKIKDVYFITGFIVDDPNYINEFSPRIFIEIQSELLKRNIDCVFAFHKDDPKMEEHILNRAKSRDYYGIIVTPVGYKENNKFYKDLYKYNQNIVFLDNNIEEDFANYVLGNSYEITYKMVSKLDFTKIEKVFIVNDTLNRNQIPCNLRLQAFIDYFNKINFTNYEILQGENYTENTTENLVVEYTNYLRENIKNYKNIGLFCVNASWSNSIINVLREELKNLDSVAHLTFGKMFAKLSKNSYGYWAKCDTKNMAKAVVDIIEKNQEKKEKIVIDYIIEKL